MLVIFSLVANISYTPILTEPSMIKPALHFASNQITFTVLNLTISMPALSKAWLCGCSLVGIAFSNPAVGMGVCLICVVRYLVDVCASGLSLAQRFPTDCDVCECDGKTPILRRPLPIRSCQTMKITFNLISISFNLQTPNVIYS